jgi:hypothetical protein
MQVFIHPQSTRTPPKQEEDVQTVQHVVLFAENDKDRTRLKEVANSRRTELFGFHPDGESEVELEMPLYMNEGVLLREVQRVVGYTITRIEKLPEPKALVPHTQPATATTSMSTVGPSETLR